MTPRNPIKYRVLPALQQEWRKRTGGDLTPQTKINIAKGLLRHVDPRIRRFLVLRINQLRLTILGSRATDLASNATTNMNRNLLRDAIYWHREAAQIARKLANATDGRTKERYSRAESRHRAEASRLSDFLLR